MQGKPSSKRNSSHAWRPLEVPEAGLCWPSQQADSFSRNWPSQQTSAKPSFQVFCRSYWRLQGLCSHTRDAWISLVWPTAGGGSMSLSGRVQAPLACCTAPRIPPFLAESCSTEMARAKKGPNVFPTLVTFLLETNSTARCRLGFLKVTPFSCSRLILMILAARRKLLLQFPDSCNAIWNRTPSLRWHLCFQS